MFISRHVLFDESQFPFADVYSGFHKHTDSTLLNNWRLSNLQQNEESDNQADSQANEEELGRLTVKLMKKSLCLQNLHL